MGKKSVEIRLDNQPFSVEIEDEPVAVDASNIVVPHGLMEEIHHIMHQPLYYQDAELMDRWAKQLYSEIRRQYYEVFWGLLPQPLRERIEHDQ